MLAFLPWLKVGVPIVQGPFHLFPQGVGDVPPEGVASQVSAATMGKVLSQYRESANFPLRLVTVLQYEGRPLGADLDGTDRAAVFQFGQHLAVSGMSDRRFIGGFADGYTASGHYEVVIQEFSEPYRGTVSMTHRRKDGHASVVMGQSDFFFQRPAHLVSQGEPNLNLPLLAALQARGTLPEEVLDQIDSSVTQYVVSNGDSPDVPLDAESVATYAALERVTGSSQRLDDIQAKLPALLAQVDSSPWVARLVDELGLPAGSHRPVLRSWLKQIYVLRGSTAHGKSAPKALQSWSQREHLLAGAFVYPLALKCLLAQHGIYDLNEEDVAWTLGLEKLLDDRPFFEVPVVPQRAGESDDAPDAEVDERNRAHLNRWQRQFDGINDALLGIALSRDISDAIDEVNAASKRSSGGL
jgi:hypothetical protein